MTLPTDDKGQYIAYAWPGGYPVLYLTQDGGDLCPGCANGQNGSDASETIDDPQWLLVAYHVYYEGPPITCDHCGGETESAYGDPEVTA